MEFVDKPIHDAEMDKAQIQDIVLVGGSTRIHKIQTLLRNVFDCEIHQSINPDEVVARRAAIQASNLYSE